MRAPQLALSSHISWCCGAGGDECMTRTRQVKDIERKMSVMTPAWEEEDRSAEEARQWEWGVFQCKERACICVQVGQLSSSAAAWDLYLFTTLCVVAAQYETHTNPLKRSYLPAGSCHTHRPLCSPCSPSTDALISSLLCWGIRVKRVVREKKHRKQVCRTERVWEWKRDLECKSVSACVCVCCAPQPLYYTQILISSKCLYLFVTAAWFTELI